MQNLFFNNTEYNSLSDIELIDKIKAGDKNALNYLVSKYSDVVNMKVGKYFIVGAEKDDIVQEGLIGLFKAIKCFNPDKQSSFKTFANLCIERQLQTAIKSSTRQKHMPLNSYLSLNSIAYDENDDTSLLEILNLNPVEDPLDTITKKEYYDSIENKIDKNLSDFEKKVLQRYSNGDSYVEIAQKLNAPVKSVDNAIQRIRKKAMKNIIDE
ncbi:MAG: RNA polymerase sporulation sigma factor SigH [Clostridia bacterium]|nr:RNA polymerase sporulation sigma factor SigH [Clostridia bacterium]